MDESHLNPLPTDTNVDQLFEKIEMLLKEQHEKGGITASAKNSIDRYLNKIIKKDAMSDIKDENIVD